MLMIQLITVLLLTNLNFNCGQENDFLIPKEYFIYKNIDFQLNVRGVDWSQASKLCEAKSMRLAILYNYNMSKWLVERMTQAWITFDRLWIGARKKNGSWYWITNNQIPETPEKQSNPNSFFPPWGDELSLNKTGDCLAITGALNNTPQFSIYDCTAKLPFACQENQELINVEPHLTEIEEYESKQFFIYESQLSWPESLHYCYEKGMSLATVDDLNITALLVRAMLKSRPSIESVWIGAYWNKEDLQWIADGELLKNSSKFPPWFNLGNKLDLGNSCILLDRQYYDKGNFINTKCDLQRSFICMKNRENDGIITLTEIFNHRKYILFVIAVTWGEANQLCLDEGDGASLVNLRDMDEVDFIMNLMDDREYPVSHVWIGGRAIDGLWRWIYGDSIEEEITNYLDESKFPPWCDNSVAEEKSCLNLDKRFNKVPAMYGLECNAMNAVICAQDLD